MPEELYTPEQKATLEKGIKMMLEQGASEQDVMTYASAYKEKYALKKKDVGKSTMGNGGLVSGKYNATPSVTNALNTLPQPAEPLVTTPKYDYVDQRTFDVTHTDDYTHPQSLANKPVEQKSNLNEQVDRITTDIIDKEEEYVVPQLNYMLKDHGFKFEQTGIGDAMVVTAPNGKTLKVDLDPFMSKTEVVESDKLKEFIKANARDYEKFAKIKSNYDVYNKKFLDQKEIDDAFVVLNQDTNKLAQDTKAGIEKLKSLTPGTPEYNAIADNLEKQQLQYERNKKSLELNVGKYVAMKSEQGTYSGGIYNSILEGTGELVSGIVGMAIDNPMVMGPVTIPDEAKKAAKKAVLPEIRDALVKNIGDENTSKEWVDNAGFVHSAILGLAKSLPAMVGGTEAVLPLMYAQISDSVDKQMMDDPDFENISEDEKLLVKVPLGIVSAALERVGFRNVIESKGLLNSIALKAIGSSTAKTTYKSFDQLVENEIKSEIAKGALRIGAGGLAEFETGASQEIADISAKQIYNAVKDKKMFETPESTGAYLKQVFKAGAQEAIGGIVLGSVPAISKAASKNNFKDVENKDMESLNIIGNDPQMLSAVESDVQIKVNTGEITPGEGEAQVNDLRSTIGVINTLPSDLTVEQQKEAIPLRKKLDELIQEKERVGKAKGLVEPIQIQIDAINQKLLAITAPELAAEKTVKKAIESLDFSGFITSNQVALDEIASYERYRDNDNTDNSDAKWADENINLIKNNPILWADKLLGMANRDLKEYESDSPAEWKDVIENKKNEIKRLEKFKNDATEFANKNRIYKEIVKVEKPVEETNPKESIEITENPEPIKQLGSGANVYFETPKFRVNDNLKNGTVFVNVYDNTDSEVPMSNLEFDTPSEALYVAETLSNIYPKGVPPALLLDKVVEGIKKNFQSKQSNNQQNAIQEPKTGTILQREQSKVGETGSERGRMEQFIQGKETAIESKASQEKILNNKSNEKTNTKTQAKNQAKAKKTNVLKGSPSPAVVETAATEEVQNDENQILFITHNKEAVTGERLTNALNKVADDLIEIANRKRKGKYANHVTETQKNDILKKDIEYAESVRRGENINTFSTWQKINTELTGETPPLLPNINKAKPDSTTKEQDALIRKVQGFNALSKYQKGTKNGLLIQREISERAGRLGLDIIITNPKTGSIKITKNGKQVKHSPITEDVQEPSEDAKSFAKEMIKQGAIDNTIDIGLQPAEVRKGVEDFKNGKMTKPAKVLINALYERKSNNGFTYTERASNGDKRSVFVSFDEIYDIYKGNSGEAKDLSQSEQDALEAEFDKLFSSLTEDEQNHITNLFNDEEINQGTENQSNASNQESGKPKEKYFKLDNKEVFYHVSNQKRNGRLRPNTAPQFGTAVYFTTNTGTVLGELGNYVTESKLKLTNPVYTNTKEWTAVETLAIKLADQDYIKKNNIELGEDDEYAKYDSENTSDVDEIPAKFISDAAKQLGYDAAIDKGSSQYENEIAVYDESKIDYIEPGSEENVPLTEKQQADKEIEDAKAAFKKAMQNFQSGGLYAAPEFIRLVKAYINKGIVNVKEFIKDFKRDFDIDLDEAETQNVFDNISGVKPTKPKEKSEGKNVKKKIQTIRSFEGTVRDEVKQYLEEGGLYRESFSQEERSLQAKKLIDEFGEDVALEGVKNFEIRGALATSVLARLIKSNDNAMSRLTAEDVDQLDVLAKKGAEMLMLLEREGYFGGELSGQLSYEYENSDIGYNVEKKISEWKKQNGGEIDPEVEAKFREYDREIQELKKKIAEAEKRAEEAQGQQAIIDIQESIKREKTERKKADYTKKALTAIQNVRAKLKANAYSDVVGMVAIVDAGLATIETAIKTGVAVTEAIEKGISYIKKELKKQGVDVWEKEDKFRKDVTDSFESEGIKVQSKKPGLKKNKLKIPPQLIRDLVEAGNDTIEELTEAVKKIVEKDIPGVTTRQVRDAITDYGKTVNPNQEEIAAEIRKMKRIGRILSGLEDVANKKRPLKSGIQRDKLDAEERSLNKKLREAMKELPMDETLLEEQMKTSTDAAKQRIRNQIEDLQREIDNKEQVPRSARTVQEDAELKDLKAKRDKIKAEHEAMFKDEEFKNKKRLELAKNRTKKRIEELERRIREKDFTTKKPAKLVDDSELIKLKAEKIRVQNKYDVEFYKNALENRTKTQKIIDSLWDAWGITRVLSASFDLSFMLVQGSVLTLSHPLTAIKAFKESLRVMASDKKLEEFLSTIEAQDFYSEVKGSKLALSKANGELKAREELFYSDWTDLAWKALGLELKLKSESAYQKWVSLNPFKAVERAAVGYLDTLRIVRFMEGREMLLKQGITYEKNPDAYKQLADVINTFTGRASLGLLEQNAPLLTKIFFSPRNWASVFKTASPWALYYIGSKRAGADPWKPSVAQKVALSDYAKAIAFTYAMTMLIKAYLDGDDDEDTKVEMNPTSSDFLKIKLGNKRIDPWGGRQQEVVLTSKLIAGFLNKPIKKTSGEYVMLGTANKAPTMFGAMVERATNKLNPSASLLYKYLDANVKEDGKRYNYGKELVLSQEIKDRMYPMIIGTAIDLAKDDPSVLNGVLGIYSILGGSVNIYDKKPEHKRKPVKRKLRKRREKNTE